MRTNDRYRDAATQQMYTQIESFFRPAGSLMLGTVPLPPMETQDSMDLSIHWNSFGEIRATSEREQQIGGES